MLVYRKGLRLNLYIAILNWKNLNRPAPEAEGPWSKVAVADGEVVTTNAARISIASGETVLRIFMVLLPC
jgi:hypothetical protein